MRLSIIIPVFNEQATVLEVVERVRGVSLDAEEIELVIVDDGSTDGTAELLRGLPADRDLVVHLAERNMGKGMAVRQGIQRATGDYVVFQDADLELDPKDIGELLAPVRAGSAEIVYGSRFLGKPPLWSISYVANRALTVLTNVLFGCRLTDMETCYKLFPAVLVKSFVLTATRFEIEPELTAKALRLGHRIHEVPINYYPRTVLQGKKMRWRDGLTAVRMLLGQRFAPRAELARQPSSPGVASLPGTEPEPSSRNG